MKLSIRVVFIFAIALVTAQAAFCQTTQDFRLLATGGFLGQLDGFQELPTAKYSKRTMRSALGGLEAVTTWVNRYSSSDPTFVLVSADNFPAHFVPEDCSGPHPTEFWKTFKTMHADAIGLGTEDLLRALHPDTNKSGRPDKLKEFLSWFRQGACDLPFISSNLLLKRSQKKFNTIESGAVSVDANANESLPLTDELTVRIKGRVNPDSVSFTLESTAADGTQTRDRLPKPKQEPDEEPTTFKLKLATPLLPNRSYKVAVDWNNTETAVVGPLHTMELLTFGKQPRRDAPDLPIQVISKGNIDLVVFSFVDPASKSLLPGTSWNYTGAQGGDVEVEILSPVDAMKTWKKIIQSLYPNCANGTNRACIFAVISNLSDETTLKLLDSTPELRLIALPPETSLLGRAAPKVPSEYAGDLGSSALLNQQIPAATQAMLRPEWVGETILEVQGKTTTASPTKLSISSIEQHEIDGLPLEKENCRSSAEDICYFITVGKEMKLVGSAPHYQPINSADFGDVWTDEKEFALLATAVVRSGRRTEIAILPESFIDPDVIAWLKDEHDHALDWASKFILERVLFRQDRFVKAILTGKALKALLKKFSDEGKEMGTKYCVNGITPDGCFVTVKPADALKTKVNGRLLLDDTFYSVALPEALAQSLKLVYNDNRYVDLADEMDQEFQRLALLKAKPDRPKNPGRRTVSLPGVTLGSLSRAFAEPSVVNSIPPAPKTAADGMTRNPLENRPLWFFSIASPSVKFGSQGLKVPAGGTLAAVTDQFAKIPLVGSKVVGKESFSAKTRLEAGLDFKHVDFLLRGDFDLGVDRFSGDLPLGISPNQMLLGGMGRWKVPSSQFPLALFGGAFLDGNPRRPPHDQFKGTFKQCEKPAPLSDADIKNKCTELAPELVSSYPQGRSISAIGPDVEIITRKGDYRFFGFGTETFRTLEPSSRFKISQFSARLDIGRNYASREGVFVAGLPFSMNDYVMKGADGLMSDVLNNNRSLLNTKEQSVEFDYRRRPQKRFNLESTIDFVAHKDRNEHELKITVTPKYQHWLGFETTLSPKWSEDLRVQVNVPTPIPARFAFVPYWQRQWVKAKDVSDVYVVERYGIEVQVPLSLRLGHGRVAY